MAEEKKYPTPVVPLPEKEEKTVAEENIKLNDSALKTEKIQQKQQYDLSFDSMIRGLGDMMDRFSAALRGTGRTSEENIQTTLNGSLGMQIAPPIVPKPENDNTTLAVNIEMSKQETQ